MKTNLYKTALLIALVFATAEIQAQSARRSANSNNKQRTTAVRSTERKSSPEKAKSTQPARKQQVTNNKPVKKVQTQPVRSQQARNNQPVRKVQTQQAHNNQPVRKVQTQQARNSQPVRKVQTQQARNNQPVRKVQTHPVKKPVSMSTSRNPRSSYRNLNGRTTSADHYTAPVKTTRYRSSGFYGGNHYHYAYPTRKVNIHYHHNTYVNGYRVLYYPAYHDIFWTRSMYRNYHSWYPGYHWSYNYGYRIQTISIFEAKYNLGELAMVYGRVYATWYNQETDDFLLFFGGNFPNQQFTVVLPGNVARKFSWRPENYFLGEHITVTGLITTYDGSPEIVVKNKRQLDLY